MNCSQCHELFAARIENVLDEAETSRFDTHLAGCPNCRTEFSETERLVGHLADDARSTQHLALSTPVMERVLTKRALRPSRRLWFGVSAAAAATIAAVLIWCSLLPGVSLADVAAAALKQPWIHATATHPDGRTAEIWYSPAKDVSARREDKTIEYRDHALRIYYSYDRTEKVLYRVPEETRRGTEFFASMIAALRTLLESQQPVEKPLERLGLQGNGRIKREVIEQKVERTRQNGEVWIDFHLTVVGQDETMPSPVQLEVLFRVDPDTKLLRLSRYECELDGKHIVSEWHFDYPAKGPADVYDVGVPKTAKIVDRIPADDLRQVLEAVRTGRQRMDDYRAVVVECDEETGRPTGFPEILYRKGDKFRRDTAIWTDPSVRIDRNIEWPEGNDDAAGDWWSQCVEDRCLLQPMSIRDGSTVYTIDTHSFSDPDGSVHCEISGVKKYEYKSTPGETYPDVWSWRPEFACRPPLGIPSTAMDPVLELDPKEGPAGTILLRVRRVGQKPPRVKNDAGKLLPSAPDAYRYWADPARGHAIIRWAMIGDFDESGKAKPDTTIIDRMARSPSGIWYATRIRRENSIRHSDGTTTDQVHDIHVDFNVDLPDSLFEPPSPGRIR